MRSDETTPAFEAIIHPYRSLGPIGFRILLGALIFANAVVATFTLISGAWPVAGFLGLDVLAVYIAFRLSYAQALAFERVTINGEAFVVERVDRKGRRREWRFPSYWVSIWFEDGEEERGTVSKVTVRSHGRSLEVGEYLAPFERKPFAEALRKALAESKAVSAQP